MEYEKFYVGDKLLPITKVVVHIMDGNKFTSGTDGRTLNVDCPWGSQAVADIILSIVSGYRYTPFTAEQAIIDPSLELGDILEDGNLRERIYQNNAVYCSALLATLGAMEEKEIDHDYPYKSSTARGGARAASKAKADAEKKILEEHNALVAALNRQDGAPEDLAAGIDNYVRWDLENDEGYASTQLFAEIGNKAKAMIDVYVVYKDGVGKSFVDILADQITLQGQVGILGNLSISEGRLRVEKSIYTPNAVFANKLFLDGSELQINGSNKLTVTTDVGISSDIFTFGRKSFSPVEITSYNASTGYKEETVLGHE